jgi:hypothetical protein
MMARTTATLAGLVHVPLAEKVLIVTVSAAGAASPERVYGLSMEPLPVSVRFTVAVSMTLR